MSRTATPGSTPTLDALLAIGSARELSFEAEALTDVVLLAVLARHPDPEVRFGAVRGLCKTTSKLAGRVLLGSAYGDPCPRVRRAARLGA